jgi:hypothetical protein
MNNLDKAINELLQLMLVDNKPVYLTQLNELYECKKKEIEIQQCINRSEALLYSDYAYPALVDLLKDYSNKGYTLDELVSEHKLDPTLLKLVLDRCVNDGGLVLQDVLDYKTNTVSKRYIAKDKLPRPTYS